MSSQFADGHVPGSPFTIKVTGEGLNVQRQDVQKQRDAQPINDVGCECKLTFKIRGNHSFLPHLLEQEQPMNRTHPFINFLPQSRHERKRNDSHRDVTIWSSHELAGHRHGRLSIWCPIHTMRDRSTYRRGPIQGHAYSRLPVPIHSRPAP